MEGYGLYFYCLEQVARNVSKNNLTFELEHDAEIIADDTGINYKLVQDIMTYMVELRLFENEQGTITCLKMAIRLDDTTSRHPQTKLIQQRLRSASVDTTEHLRTNYEDSSARREQNRIDKSKTEQKRKIFTPPSVDQVTEYCKERQNKIDPQAFVDHYEVNGWMRGKNKIKDWKACVRTWENSGRDDTKKKKPKSDHEWQALGREKGLNAKPGETMWNYISRVREAVYGH